MSTQIEISNVNTHRTRWQAIRHWYNAFEEGMSYDPHEDTFNSIRILAQKVAQLEAKVDELQNQTPTMGGQ